jgi:hypothetical protein
VLCIIVGTIFLLTLVMPETLAPVLLKRKAAKLNKANKTNIYITEHQLHHVPLSITPRTAMIRPFILMFKGPIVLFMSFYLRSELCVLVALRYVLRFPDRFRRDPGLECRDDGIFFRFHHGKSHDCPL